MNFRIVGFGIVLGIAVLSWIATCSAWQYDEVVAGFAPQEDRNFPRLSVVTVGTGGATENPNRGGPAIAVALGERVWLVDAGRRVAEGLRAAKIPVSQPDTVLLTSVLPENTVGLDDLLLTGALAGRREPLRLLGPPGTEALARGLEAAHAAGARSLTAALDLPAASLTFDAVEIAGGDVPAWDGIRVRAAALSGGPAPALAYRFESDGRAAVVAGSGWDEDGVAGLAAGAQILVHEATFIPSGDLVSEMGQEALRDRFAREAAIHTGLEEVGSLAQRAGVSTLVLVRLRPPPVYDVQITGIVDDTFGGRIVVAEDGDEIRP